MSTSTVLINAISRTASDCLGSMISTDRSLAHEVTVPVSATWMKWAYTKGQGHREAPKVEDLSTYPVLMPLECMSIGPQPKMWDVAL
ncbi:hypothetical protein ANCDUO_19466 [Ancylostoma duodenale]|uniref:Uncharacterized protein n=1 Tax=Ancylostoma duodenale TaxID=51022 RepID=A0A0C2FPL0_9BILA|nr:hypothetical protein ANCDUO_19466 [Ancylostoma duodenale]